jgi:predicted enzyme related to lactoylglutathione lyase
MRFQAKPCSWGLIEFDQDLWHTQHAQGKERITMPVGFGQVVIDSLRADDIAGFWSALLERPVNDGANQFFAVIPASADGTFPALMFLAVPEPRQSKNRVHIDLVADDLAAEVERAVTLGATKVADFNEYGATWTTLTDPEGNIFDIGLRRETEQVSS